MKKTIIYFIGVYDTLDLFTEQLKTAFESMGYASFVYDARYEGQSKEALLGLLESSLYTVAGEAGAIAANADARSIGASTGAGLSVEATPAQASFGEAASFTCVTFNNLGYNLDLPDGRSI